MSDNFESLDEMIAKQSDPESAECIELAHRGAKIESCEAPDDADDFDTVIRELQELPSMTKHEEEMLKTHLASHSNCQTVSR